MSGPLAGVRVIDLTVAVLGPVATQILGDLGAEVIKIEAPEGDMMRSIGPRRNPDMAAYFLNINRNKKSVVLDLKRPAAQAAVLRLAVTADVLVHNMRPGAAQRCGIGYEAVATANRRIIYASASGYRPDGPNRDRAAFDDIIQGQSGFAALNADSDGSPRYAPMVIGDKICGYVLASMVGMALYAREKTGKGQEVHVPMFDTMAAFNLVDHLWHGVLGEPEKGLGYPRMLTPHRRPYATTDGHVCVLATTDRQWCNLFGALGAPELADDVRFYTIAQRPPISTSYIPGSPG
jgi:crotonobetainyl-CoA:carnitine CoA-transferase CaiB-like acyl-CoA transferase